MATTITKQDLLNELARLGNQAQDRGDWHASETYVAAWHRVNGESYRINGEPELLAFGEHGCGCARCVAGRQAAVPLDERIGAAIMLTRDGMQRAMMAAGDEARSNGGIACRYTD